MISYFLQSMPHCYPCMSSLWSCVNHRIWIYILFGGCFGLFCCCFWQARSSFHTVSVLNGIVFLPQTASPGPTFFFQKMHFLSPQNWLHSSASCPCSRAEDCLSFSRNCSTPARTARCYEHKALPITWALGSSEDTDMSSGLWNRPLQLLNLL